MTRGLAATGAIAITGDRCSTGCAGAGDCIFWKAADGCSLPAEALEEEEECCTGAFSEPRAEGAAGEVAFEKKLSFACMSDGGMTEDTHRSRRAREASSRRPPSGGISSVTWPPTSQLKSTRPEWQSKVNCSTRLVRVNRRSATRPATTPLRGRQKSPVPCDI